MNNRGALREARRLRVKMQTDGRFHLEVLAALSRTFRENGESVSNDLLRSLVFAVPDELPGRGSASAMVNSTGRPAYVKIPPQPGVARRKGKKKRGKKRVPSIPPQPGVARGYRAAGGIPPQPGAARRKGKKKSGKKRVPSIPPQPGVARGYRAAGGIPPQPGAARRKSKKGGKKAAKR